MDTYWVDVILAVLIAFIIGVAIGSYLKTIDRMDKNLIEIKELLKKNQTK